MTTHKKQLFFTGIIILLVFSLMAPAFYVKAAATGPLAAINFMNNVKTPKTGDKSVSDSGATIDISNTSEGYVMIRYSGSASKVKAQVVRNGSTTYTYDLNTSGKYEVFPLTSGDGSYTISVFENVYGNQYAMIANTTTQVSLSNSTLPFLYPSQYVNFNEDSDAVKKSEELVAGSTDPLDIVGNIYHFIIKNISYDTKKANNVKPGYLPVVDTVLSSGKGICFDYAALMAAMLRSQGIPTRLQIGYVSGGLYHAWISVYTTKTGWIDTAIYFDGTSWKLMDPTFASGSQSAETMKFIGNGKNYSTVYIY